MDGLLQLHAIRFFSFYLAVIFTVSTYLRLRQYRAALALLVGLRTRWPNLTRLVLAHRHIFLTRGTVLPLGTMLALLAANLLASRLVWPQADRFTVADLLRAWPAVPFVALSGAAMVAFDVWGTARVGKIDRAEMEKYFDQAEFWLEGWKAPVVRLLSLGHVNPRQMVAAEVRAALEGASRLLNSTLWWVSIQTTLRILFGLCLWGSYALSSYLVALAG
jgi:hypothetical protein